MGRIVLISRLVRRDLCRRPFEAVLLLLAITAATATLTLGFALSGVTDQPFARTRAATSGPDVTATSQNPGPTGQGAVASLVGAPGVIGHGGPYPLALPTLTAHGKTVTAIVEGRAVTPAAIDRPQLTAGTWVRPGAVVLERSYADVLGLGTGDTITLNATAYRVAGIAVTASVPQYPDTALAFATASGDPGPGLIWATETDARALATPAQPLSYLIDVKLADPDAAQAFADAHSNDPDLSLTTWQDVGAAEARQLQSAQLALLVGSWLLGMLAIASITVMVGGRMAEQIRRVGLLKAAGGTPGLVAAVLLTENLLLALIAAVAGLGIGWLAAPLFTSPGTGLLGTPAAPSLTPATIAAVAAVAIAVAIAATLAPALRAARTSTVRALADAAQAPGRRDRLIKISTRLPVPLLLGLRLAARRPRRSVLGAASITITVATLVTVLAAHAHQTQQNYPGQSTLNNPKFERTDQVLVAITVALVVLAIVNALFITWTSAIDARQPMAVARALGATPRQVAAGLAAAQVLPATAGALLGIPAGLALFQAASHGQTTVYPPVWWLAVTVVCAVLAIAALAAVPARFSTRRSAAHVLHSELG